MSITTFERAIEAVPPENMVFEEWVNEARSLFADQRQAEWKVAEWLRIGIERFPDEPQLNLFLDQIGVDKKRALADAKVAKLIPPSWRTDKISFEVCKHIAKVEDPELRQRMLKRAADEHWNERAAHHAIVEHKVATGQLFEDDDAVSRLATEIFRQWNRMPIEAREYAYPLIEMAAATGFGPIDEDTAI